MKRKILYVRNGPYKVNYSSYNLQEVGFCKALCERGFDCDIVYYSDENKDEQIYECENSKVNILWRKGYKILRTGLYPKLLVPEFVNKYDLIITTEYSQIMTLLWTRYNPKVVLYTGPYYNLFKIPFIEKIYDYLFIEKLNKKIYKTFTKSELADIYMKKKGLKNSQVLGVGLDEKNFNLQIRIDQKVEELINFMKNNKCILYVGSLSKRKNFEFLLNVFSNVYKKRNDIHLVIIGKGERQFVDKNFANIDEMTRKNIIHIENMDNKALKYIYEEADIFLLPSILEIFGMVLLEAMYFGCACISSSNGGSTTLIQNDNNGVIIDEFDETVWSEKIINILDNDKKREEIGERAKRTIREKFTWDKIADNFLISIDEVIQGEG